MSEYSVKVPEFQYDAFASKPTAEVSAATGYEWEAVRLTADQCRAFAASLIAAAERLDAVPVGLDRMTNYSPLRHRTPFEPYELKRAKGTNTMWDDFAKNLRQQINALSWLDGTARIAGGWEKTGETTQRKIYR